MVTFSFLITDIHYIIGEHYPSLTITFTTIDNERVITKVNEC